MCPMMQTKKATFLCAQKRLKKKIHKQNKKDSILRSKASKKKVACLFFMLFKKLFMPLKASKRNCFMYI